MQIQDIAGPFITGIFLLLGAFLSFVGLGMRRSLDEMRDAIRSLTTVNSGIAQQMAVSAERDSEHRREIQRVGVDVKSACRAEDVIAAQERIAAIRGPRQPKTQCD